MPIHLKDNAAVVKNGDAVTILLDTDAASAQELRMGLARINGSGIGNPSPEVRQLLNDLEAALHEALRVRMARKRARPALRKVCQISDCGCSGLAHP